MQLTPRRRHLISTVLALVLAAESVSVVAAAAQVTAAGRALRPVPVTAAQAAADTDSRASTSVEAGPAPAPLGDSLRDLRAASLAPGAATTSASPRRPAAGTGAPGETIGTTPASPAPPAPRVAAPTTTRYAGRNHVWIPALGINRSVSAFPCDRTRPPDNYVYRWGCAGTNNVYLLGHAYSVFKPLHDAYVAGRLKVGMKAWYADGSAKVHAYTVAWWKVTLPTTSASWAWAPQSRPSMTLQTCVGANSEYRLMVRLVEVAG